MQMCIMDLFPGRLIPDLFDYPFLHKEGWKKDYAAFFADIMFFANMEKVERQRFGLLMQYQWLLISLENRLGNMGSDQT